MIEIESVNLRERLHGPHNGYRWFWDEIERDYPSFFRILHGEALPPISARALKSFYGMAVLFVYVIRGLWYDSAGALGVPRLELTEHGSLTALLPKRPIIIVLEEKNPALHEVSGIVYGVVYQIRLERCPGLLPSNWKYMMVLNLPSKPGSSVTLVERLGEVIDRFLSRWRPTGPAGGDQRCWRNLSFDGDWYFSYPDDELGESGSSRSLHGTI